MKLLQSAMPLVATVSHRGFTAASNILVTIMAGRALDPVNFGELALLMATTGLFLLLHSSLFSEPMLVYGPREYQESTASYIKILGIAQFTAALLLALAAVTASVVMERPSLLPFAFILLLQLTLDFLDRTFFMQLRPSVPAATAACQFLVIAALASTEAGQTAGAASEFLWMLAASLAVANAGSLAIIAFGWTGLSKGNANSQTIVQRHRDFAGWSILSHLLLFMVTGFYIFMLPMLQSLEETAAFRAQAAIIGAGVQAFSAVGMVSVPMLRVCRNLSRYHQVLQRFALLVVGSGLIFWLGVGLFGDMVLDLVYDGRYRLTTSGYWLAGSYPLAIGSAFLAGSALRALDCAMLVARSAGLAVLVTLVPGLFLIHQYGAEGAILAQILGAWVMTLASIRYILTRSAHAFVDQV